MSENGIKSNLSKMISEDCILLDVEARDVENALRLGCELLVKSGAVTEKYCDLIIESFYKNGPYFVIAPNFALSHAKNDDKCVKKLAFSFVRLSKPIYFGHPYNDPVYLILTLATPDDKTHINAMAKLSEKLMDETTWKVLKEGNKKSIIEIFT